MNSYLFMDQESKNQQCLLDFLGLLPEMVVTTMCTEMVTIVDIPIQYVKWGTIS